MDAFEITLNVEETVDVTVHARRTRMSAPSAVDCHAWR